MGFPSFFFFIGMGFPQIWLGVNLVQKFEGFDGDQEYGFGSEIRVPKIVHNLDVKKVKAN